MLKIDRVNTNLERLSVKTLTQAKILERHDLQKMIVRDPDPFFEEMGEKLVLVGQEVKPSQYVNDSIDLLAIDESGAAVIIELKRAEFKLQLFQALSYAAMLADWDDTKFFAKRSEFAQETVQDASDAISDHLGGPEELGLNQSQRVILIAENFDYALLRTAEWLSEIYGINIRCYRLGYASDGPSEYLSCTCVYPPIEIADQASRARKPKILEPDQEVVSWEEVMKSIQNSDVKSFFEKSRTMGRENRLTSKGIYFRVEGRRRFGVHARKKHAWVVQFGRFERDEEFWKGLLSEPSKVTTMGHGRRLSFALSSPADFEKFQHAIDTQLPKVTFFEADDEEGGASGQIGDV